MIYFQIEPNLRGFLSLFFPTVPSGSRGPHLGGRGGGGGLGGLHPRGTMALFNDWPKILENRTTEPGTRWACPPVCGDRGPRLGAMRRGGRVSSGQRRSRELRVPKFLMQV